MNTRFYIILLLLQEFNIPKGECKNIVLRTRCTEQSHLHLNSRFHGGEIDIQSKKRESILWRSEVTIKDDYSCRMCKSFSRFSSFVASKSVFCYV